MIKVKCPYCSRCRKEKNWKEGIQDICPSCGKHFKLVNIRKWSFTDFESHLAFDAFNYLLKHDMDNTKQILSNELGIDFGPQSTDAASAEAFLLRQKALEPHDELTKIFIRLNKERKDLCEKLYQRWMDFVR